MKKSIAVILKRFQISPSCLGCGYLISAADILTTHPEYICHITKCIYPEVAKAHRTSAGCVERNIRTVIEMIWKRGGKEYFSVPGYYSATGRRPTNTQFFNLSSENVALSQSSQAFPGWCSGCSIPCPRISRIYDALCVVKEENRRLRDELLRTRGIEFPPHNQPAYEQEQPEPDGFLLPDRASW